MTTTTTNDTTTTTTTTNELQVAMLQVFTTPQKIETGSATELVQCATRNSKDTTVATENRMRCIVIPELAVDGIPSKFHSMVMDALRRTAKEQLASIWKNEPAVKEVPAAIWSVDSLVIYAAQEAESKRLTKVGIEAWWNESELCKYLMQQGNAKKLKDWQLRIAGMAAPALVLGVDECTKTIAAIGKFEGDADSMIGAQMITKLQARIEALSKQVEEIEEV